MIPVGVCQDSFRVVFYQSAVKEPFPNQEHTDDNAIHMRLGGLTYRFFIQWHQFFLPGPPIPPPHPTQLGARSYWAQCGQYECTTGADVAKVAQGTSVPAVSPFCPRWPRDIPMHLVVPTWRWQPVSAGVTSIFLRRAEPGGGGARWGWDPTQRQPNTEALKSVLAEQMEIHRQSSGFIWEKRTNGCLVAAGFSGSFLATAAPMAPKYFRIGLSVGLAKCGMVTEFLLALLKQ